MEFFRLMFTAKEHDYNIPGIWMFINYIYLLNLASSWYSVRIELPKNQDQHVNYGSTTGIILLSFKLVCWHPLKISLY